MSEADGRGTASLEPMAEPTPRQELMRERVEGLIALAAPVLDLVLAAGDRVARLLGPDEETYPIRPPGEAFSLRTPEEGGARDSDSASDPEPGGPGGA